VFAVSCIEIAGHTLVAANPVSIVVLTNDREAAMKRTRLARDRNAISRRVPLGLLIAITLFSLPVGPACSEEVLVSGGQLILHGREIAPVERDGRSGYVFELSDTAVTINGVCYVKAPSRDPSAQAHVREQPDSIYLQREFDSLRSHIEHGALVVVVGRGYTITFPPDRVDRALASIDQIPERARKVPSPEGGMDFGYVIIDGFFWPARFVRDVMSARKGGKR
jgi:hypothetical protein